MLLSSHIAFHLLSSEGSQYDCRACEIDQPLLYRVGSDSTETISNLHIEKESVVERAGNQIRINQTHMLSLLSR